jgi:hypothetical protein
MGISGMEAPVLGKGGLLFRDRRGAVFQVPAVPDATEVDAAVGHVLEAGAGLPLFPIPGAVSEEAAQQLEGRRAQSRPGVLDLVLEAAAVEALDPLIDPRWVGELGRQVVEAPPGG